jgi:tetratricopeptide (TPR) repeat protein
LVVQLWTFALLVGFTTGRAAETARNTTPSADPLARADSLFAAGFHDSALRLVARIAGSAGPGDEQRLDALIAEGRIAALGGRLPQAEQALAVAMEEARAQRDSSREAQALRWAAYARGARGLPREAEALWRRLLELSLARGDRRHEAYARFGLAYARDQRGEDRDAAREYERAAVLLREAGDERMELWALAASAGALMALRDEARSRTVLLHLVDRSRELGNREVEGGALNDLGVVEFHYGDPGLAESHFRSALELQRTGPQPFAQVTPRRNLGLVLTYLGRLDDAGAHLDTALALCVAQRATGPMATVLEQYGYLRREQKRPREAAALFRSAIALNDSAGLQPFSQPWLGLAASLADVDSAAAGLAALEELVSRRPSLSSWDRLYLREARVGLLTKLGRHQEAIALGERALADTAGGMRLGLLVYLGRSHLAMGRPRPAIAVLERAARKWEGVRARRRDLEWREQAGEHQHDLYATLGTAWLLEPGAATEEERARRAFDAVQQFKTRTLLERIGEGSAGDVRRVPPSVSLARLQGGLLHDGELWLDFYVGSERAILFAVTRGECRALRFSFGARELGPRVRRFHALLSRPPHRDDGPALERVREASARALGTELLGGVADLLRRSRRVLLAPDGILHLVPAGALVVPLDSTGGGRPLIETHEIVHVPSAALLAALRGRGREHPAIPRVRGVLVLSSPPALVLPGAAREARWLASRFFDVELQRGRNGTPERTLTGKQAHEVLHVAAHIRADDQRPWLSGIVLGTPRGGEGDSLLRASSIAALDLPARLAVLSGCESAGGRVTSGEGVVGLTSAFLDAEVPAVVATLWPVSDDATVSFMSRFYQALGAGRSAAAALREAQRASRGTAATSHPFYWGGFVLVGEGDLTVRLERRPAWPAPAGIAVVLAALAGWAWRRRWAAGRPVTATPPRTLME